jgi:peroxiredoxin
MKRVVLAIAVVFCLFPLSLSALSQGDSSTSQQEHPVSYETLDGGVISVEELAQGRWALGFIVYPDCPACEKVVEWFEQAAEAPPEVKFLLIAPEATPELRELVKNHALGIPVLLDQDGVLGTELEIKRAPTVFLSAEGMYITQLDWPFTEGRLLRELTESLLIEFPNPRDLLGKQAPNFSAVNLNGDKIWLTDFPRPLLLVFFDANCPSCWGCLPILTQLAEEMAVALVVPVREAGLPVADRERLESFQRSLKEKPVYLLLAQGSKALEAYKLAVSPTYFLINGKRVIVGVWQGKAHVDDLLGVVRNLE